MNNFIYQDMRRWFISDNGWGSLDHSIFFLHTLKEYAQWRIENPTPTLKPYIVYPKDMDIINKIFAVPIVKVMLTMQQESERSKPRPAVDHVQMNKIFFEKLKQMMKEE